MNDLESQLSRQPLAAPSTALDRRIAQTFAVAAVARPKSVNELWWWPVAIASFGAVVVLLLALMPPRPAPINAPVQVHFEANAALRRLLLTPATHHEPPPRLNLGVPST